MYITEEECLAYADLVLFLVGADKGDTVLLNAEIEHEPFINALTKQAYRLGVKYVQHNISSEKFSVYRALYGGAEDLSYVPRAMVETMRETLDSKSCVISVRSPQDPAVAQAASAQALGAIHKGRREALEFFHRGIVTDALSWIVIAFPTEGWAKNVYPELPPHEGVRTLWETVKGILKLNEADPRAAWQTYQTVLRARGTYLNAKRYRALHFTGEGTDLRVALHERSTWISGAHFSQNGKYFQANLPTEEVYTSPDCRYTSGTVRIRRPITIFGKKIDGITMRFENGRVVEYDAQTNKDVLDGFFAASERNAYMGEIALVDINSGVWKSGKVFNSILYDENAGVHFALGTAYTSGYGYKSTDTQPSEAELIAMGCNCCSFHEDFTAGYEGLHVFGVTASGDEEPIIQNGLFVID